MTFQTVKCILVYAGVAFSLQLQLYAGLPDYWSSVVGTYGQRGYHVLLHNQSDYPIGPFETPVLVTPGFGVELSLQRAFYSQYNAWPYAYSDCRVDSDNQLMGSPLNDPYLFEQVIKTNFSYSRSSCIAFCAQLFTTKTCGCNSYDLQLRVEGYDLCLVAKDRNCSSEFYANTFLSGSFISDNCLDKCPLECSQSILTPKMTYYNFPSLQDAYVQEFNAQLIDKYANQTDFNTYQQLQQNLVELIFYYDSLSFTTVEEKPDITVDKLVGTLGGHLHLFLGLSLLGLVELIEFVVFSCLLLIKWPNQELSPIRIVEAPSQLVTLRVDAVPNIAKSSRHPEKCIWLALFVLSSGVCVFLFVGSIREYLKFEVTTTSRLLQDQRVKFPVVTICPSNQFNTNYSIEITTLANFDFSNDPDTSRAIIFIEKYIHNTTGSYMTDEQKRNLTDFDSMLVDCHIGPTKCDSSMFVWEWNPMYFNCYRFNTGFSANGSKLDEIMLNIYFEL